MRESVSGNARHAERVQSSGDPDIHSVPVNGGVEFEFVRIHDNAVMQQPPHLVSSVLAQAAAAGLATEGGHWAVVVPLFTRVFLVHCSRAPWV